MSLLSRVCCRLLFLGKSISVHNVCSRTHSFAKFAAGIVLAGNYLYPHSLSAVPLVAFRLGVQAVLLLLADALLWYTFL